jgi:hypothetical protein
MYDLRQSLAIGKATDMFDFCQMEHVMAATSEEWADLAKRYLKGEMARAGVKNAELAKRLTEMGLPETDASVQVKINRGAFPAWFLLAALRALGATSLRLE